MVSFLKRETFDMLLLLGNLSYDVFYSKGQRGDMFFDALEPIITWVPLVVVPGNWDMTDNGRVLLNRF